MISSEDILLKYWKHKSFRLQQKQIIESVLEGNDTIALLPTGGGKSVCYQVPAMQKKGVCIVISPLIALMKDQVTSLQTKDIKAVALTSELNIEDTIIAFDNLQFGNYKFVYLSPEKLQSPLILEKLKQLSINLIAIDEAHCISTWGHDFRPSYLKLKILKELFSKIPILALTATATTQVIEDIRSEINLKEPTIFKSSFYRKNIAYHVLKTEDTLTTLVNLLKKHQTKPSIIFVNTRKKTQQIQLLLQKKGLQSSYYHGGLSNIEKEKAYNDWFLEKKKIMVATNAFGMGIDKNNVAIIIHLHIPLSIENYMQESGRAGRDNCLSNALILIHTASAVTTKNTLQKNLPDIPFFKLVYKNINNYFQISLGETLNHSQPFDLHAFCAHFKLPILKTIHALQMLENLEIISYQQHANSQSILKFKIGANEILSYTNAYSQYQKVIKLLLRSYGGIINNPTTINETYLASKLDISKKQLQTTLEILKKENIIVYKKAIQTALITFLVPRDDNRTIYAVQHKITAANQRKIDKVNAMINYVKDESTCRSKQLVSYFGEALKNDCGICDVCKKKGLQKTLSFDELALKITSLLKAHKALNSKEISIHLNTTKENTLIVLQMLLEKNIISLNSQHQFSIIL